ncbi:amidohydrolase [Congregibacter brevis]|uniref:Amidohydrolase n=1 Tax=Congregibacter brevis TaxID=3081201 RepID=A0ABZ0ID98_9GAMM|nr:amidohydrolase [Congregibacter sp. IMCC45268]
MRHAPINEKRRHLLKALATASAAASVSGPSWANMALGKADLIVTGGTFHTMDIATSNAQAMAVRGNRILAVGSIADINDLAGPGTRRIDARGLTVTPGFIDAHSHPLMANEAISVDVNVRQISKVQSLLQQQAQRTPPGQWVLAHMYDDTKFNEGRPLTRQDIDAVVPSQPVMVRHRGGHTAVVNSQAFAIAGIDNDTPDPEGGRFFREDGQLTGKVAELAMFIFNDVGEWPVVDRETNRKGASLMTKRMAASGLTSTTDAFGDLEGWVSYMDALDAGELYTRIAYMPGGNTEAYQTMKRAGMRSGFGNPMLRVGAVKYAADGSASERTMRMSTPFEGTDDYGILTMSQEQIDAAVDDAVANDFRIGIHANGDVTIDMVLQAYERVLKDWEGVNPRFRIEHCSLVNPLLLKRIKATGTIPTPFYTYAYYHGNKWVDYGSEKMRSMFAHRSFIDEGIMVAPASDFTPGPYEPMMALQSMVTRQDSQGRIWGDNQRITAAEAMQVCTVNGAYASFEEHDKGTLTPGKLADFVLLGQDPLKTDPNALKDIPIVATYLDGQAVFEA